MKISEMKKELESYGISTATILEKSELVTALEEARSERHHRRSSKSEPIAISEEASAELRHKPTPATQVNDREGAGSDMQRYTVKEELAHNSFPKSNFFTAGIGLIQAGHIEEGVDALKRGAETNGCVPCMHKYAEYYILQRKNEIVPLTLPWLLEGAIRGHFGCMHSLIDTFYNKSKPARAGSLNDYWGKTQISLYPDIHLTTTEERKNTKKNNGSICNICRKTDLDEGVTLVACGKCGYYYYCGKKCQLIHWKAAAGNHIGECNHLKILKKYHRPYAEEIRDKIIRGDDPKSIPELQELRTKLGLNRPKEDYEELILHLSDDNIFRDNYNRKNGTVHIGSTPETI
jgi:hypothetical protein